MSKNVTGTIREKKGLYYAVVNYYDDIISKFRKSIDSTRTDQMEWVRRMNFARHYAEELVLAEYVYPEGVERE